MAYLIPGPLVASPTRRPRNRSIGEPKLQKREWSEQRWTDRPPEGSQADVPHLCERLYADGLSPLLSLELISINA